MQQVISNHYLTAIIDPKGAQLISLKKTNEDVEYIWEADPKVWGRHAPILFPIVGRLKEDHYTYNGKRYTLGQHGFARNLMFRKLVDNSDMVMMELQENEETLEVFPFKFALQVSHYLWKNILYCKYEVHNTDDKEIYFSIGGHPGFTCPLSQDAKRSDYYLEFEKDETEESHILEGGNLSGRTKQVIEQKKISITDDLFDEDALIFKGLNSDKISLKHRSGQSILHFHYPKFPYLGIWSMSQTSPYVCIEPWYGLADNADHDGDITKKEGIQSLPPGEVFSCEFGIEIE